MAVLKTKPAQDNEFVNWHFNGPWPLKTMHSIRNEWSIPDKIAEYNDGTSKVQGLMKDSLATKEGLRAFGSKWSLSSVGHQKDQMIANALMNMIFDISANDVHPNSPYKFDNLFFVQCGTIIKELNNYLKNKNKSLKTCGASNGQTIVGAMSTGVHGSALDIGSVQDYIVGIHLITGPGPNDNLYIERSSKPALDDAFPAKINGRVIRNDKIFNAVLVSMGSFGFIHGVTLEAENLYLLKRYIKHVERDVALDLAENMNFDTSSFKIVDPDHPEFTGARPYHYKLYINPYNQDEEFVCEIIYKTGYNSNYPDPIPRIKKAIYKDLPSWIAVFAARHKRKIPKIIKALSKQAFPEVGKNITGTLGEIFFDTSNAGAAWGCAIGIDHKDASKALKAVEGMMNTDGPVPGILSMRFVKATEATLGFTKFSTTCILEGDGVQWEGSRKIISMEDFLKRIVEVLQQANIKFALHWGKNAAWSFPGLTDYMYGVKKQEWIDIRSALLSREMADMFSNDFLHRVGLDTYNNAPPANVVNAIT